METPDKCQHYMLTFELHEQLCKATLEARFCTFINFNVAALDAFRLLFLAKITFVQQNGQPLT